MSDEDGNGAAAGPPEVTADVADAEIVSLLDDEYARALLVVAYDEARPADELAETLGTARSTVYDRLSRLGEHDLVVEHQEIDPDGHHYKTYRTRLDRVVIEVAADGVEVAVDREPTDPADRLSAAFDTLRS
jgi:DNA-binding transcriptional ArsR family regulator